MIEKCGCKGNTGFTNLQLEKCGDETFAFLRNVYEKDKT
jgi:hypothetical protein